MPHFRLDLRQSRTVSSVYFVALVHATYLVKGVLMSDFRVLAYLKCLAAIPGVLPEVQLSSW